jgi:phage shock protein A
MNLSVYIFGKFGQGITASVSDYTKKFFEEFISKANAPTQIIIHRDGDIMNYGYVRRIENNHLFGICIQLNNQYFSTINNLFETFEGVVANIAIKGDIIRLNKKGDLEAISSNILDTPTELERIIAICQSEFAKLSDSCRDLPHIDFSTTSSNVNHFKESDNSYLIIETSLKNGYTFIYKEQDYDTLTLSGYRITLSKQNKENEALKKRINDLDRKLKILERKKKQMGVVVALLITLFLGSVVFFNTLEEKNNDIKEREIIIDEQIVKNEALREENKEIQGEITELENHNSKLRATQESTNQKLNNINNENKDLEKSLLKARQENNSYAIKIKSLTTRIEYLENKLNKSEIDLANKNDDYKKLQSKYSHVCEQLSRMEKKYYSTKEGKKELKKGKK